MYVKVVSAAQQTTISSSSSSAIMLQTGPSQSRIVRIRSGSDDRIKSLWAGHRQVEDKSPTCQM